MFAVISLWGVAMSQIGGQLRQGLFPAARLAAMAVTISVVAIATLVVAGAAFFGAPSAAGDPERGIREQPACPAEVRGAFVFSFGLEQASRDVSDCSVRSAGG